MPTARLLFLISILLAFCSSMASPREDFLRDLNRAATKDQVERAINKHKSLLEPSDYENLKQRLDSDESFRVVRDSIPAIFTSYEVREAKVSGSLANPSEEARKILQSPEFRDSGSTSDRNWFAKSLGNLGEAIGNWLNSLFNQNQQMAMGGVPTGIGSAITYGVIGLLILAILAGAIYFFSKWKWSPKSVKKGGGGLLDEDEPDRTADEWLEMAETLESNSQHREAVRCLYLACLVRLDEHRVADFMRGQTNWEHLRRIHASSNRPKDWEFRTATQKFDLVWYGRVVKGRSDTEWFRNFYKDLLARLAVQAKAA